MIKSISLYIKVILLFLFIAIPITHLLFAISISLIQIDFSLIGGSFKLLPISLMVGFIPAIITAITVEAFRQSSDGELSYLSFTTVTAFLIISPYVLLLFFNKQDMLFPLLLILSSLLSTLLVAHGWWKLQQVKS